MTDTVRQNRTLKILLVILGIICITAVIGGIVSANTSTDPTAGAYIAPRVTSSAPAETFGTDPPIPTTEEPVDDSVIDPDIQRAAMESTWDEFDAGKKAQICSGWNMSPLAQDILLDTFMDNAPNFNRQLAEDFFDRVCN